MPLLVNQTAERGETRFGGNRDGVGAQGLGLDAPTGFVSYIVLLDTAGTEYCLWVSTAGKLTIGTRAQMVTPNSAGTVVGGQS